jgi:aryl-alcohol dehydrogenase (NADP+)
MEYRRLGRSGLEVSTICLGTMIFGGETDAGESARIIAHARDHGVNFLDTADVYGKGRSEEVVGGAIADERDRWVVATKVGGPMSDDRLERGFTRRWILKAAEGSLRRLGTDYIDIYYFHRDDLSPVEERLSAVADLLRAGKIRYFGVSNHRAWRIAETVHGCRELGIPQPVVCQPYYNAFNRQPEVEVLPACAHYGLGVVPYSPLARGVLTGKYPPGGEVPADSRVGRNDRRIMQTEFRDESIAFAARIKAHAEAKGLSATAFALGWLLRNRVVTSVLAGPRTFAQWESYLAGATARLDDDDEALIDSMVRPGHPSTPGYTDPNHPPTGRVVG